MKIWYKGINREPECIDECRPKDAGFMVHEYSMAFGLLPGQHRHGKDFVWAGRKKDQPKEQR